MEQVREKSKSKSDRDLEHIYLYLSQVVRIRGVQGSGYIQEMRHRIVRTETTGSTFRRIDRT